MNYLTPKAKIDQIRQAYIAGNVDPKLLCARVGLSVITVRKYLAEFRVIEQTYPARLRDVYFRLPRVKWVAPAPERYRQLIAALPGLMEEVRTTTIEIELLWKDYREKYPEGYSLEQFRAHVMAWKKQHNICRYWHRRVKYISDEDLTTLNNWRSFSPENWKRAVIVLDSYQGKPVAETGLKIEMRFQSVLKWVERFKEKGIAGLTNLPYVNPGLNKLVAEKQVNIMKLLHETPAIHGFNRVAWRVEDLAAAYGRTYGERIGVTTISWHLKKLGYGYRKSREVLTSPDPDFREKLAHLKKILSGLGPNEKFFSIDEMGPFSVRKRGGRSFVPAGELIIIPKVQKSKGWLICTAALELSTNQVTHFYSLRKDTTEMLKLLDILLVQYHSADKLYLSWDAATWHMSKKLMERLVVLNSTEYRDKHSSPLVELTPLPSSAQFLNVIESVFSGLAKAVLHNSDYLSVELCKEAIDRHFLERNQYFMANPKKAGNKIWGKERIEPVFDESKNSKYHNYR